MPVLVLCVLCRNDNHYCLVLRFPFKELCTGPQCKWDFEHVEVGHDYWVLYIYICPSHLNCLQCTRLVLTTDRAERILMTDQQIFTKGAAIAKYLIC